VILATLDRQNRYHLLPLYGLEFYVDHFIASKKDLQFHLFTPSFLISSPLIFILKLESRLSETLSFKIVEGELGSGQFFLISNFDGQNLEQFIDTGSTFTSLPWSLFSNYPKTGSTNSKGLANNQNQHDKISIQKVSIAGHILNSFEAIRLKDQSKMIPTLGIDAFQSSNFIFDPKHKELSFLKTNTFGESPAFSLEIGKRGHILLKTCIENYSYNAIWDTGAGLTTIDENMIKKSPDNFEYLQTTEGDDCNESSLSLKLYRAKIITIGNLSFKNLDVLVHDFQPVSEALGEQVDLALGFNAIIQKKWLFNLVEKTWTAN
jgi:predicted aspartyl protease